jgi:transposase
MKTTKAQKILDMTADGLSAIQIAKKMGVSPAYVYVVRSKAKKKASKAKKKASKPKYQEFKVLESTEPKVKVEWVETPDPVNSPPHYTNGGIETIDYIEAKDLNYRLGNVVKYVSRAGKKIDSDPLKDLLKAQWYLQREIDARERA